MAKTITDPKYLDQLLRQISQGERDALSHLYHAAGAPIYAYALSILRNRQDAEDVLHDCFVSVWTSASGYRSEDKPMAWLLTISRNLCYKRLREQKRTARLTDKEVLCAENTDPEQKLILESCLQQLSEQDQQILILHAVAGMKHRQIATYLDLPLATVLSKYHRAIKKVKANFGKENV